MEAVKEKSIRLYWAQVYGKEKTADQIWGKIKNNREILEKAIDVIKDKRNIRDIFYGCAICERMIVESEDIPRYIYKKIVNLVCSNPSLSKIISSYKGKTLLTLVLENNDVYLNSEQRKFIVEEALGKHDYNKKMEYVISEEGFSFANICHGSDTFDIRYYILKNDSFNFNEKEKLIYEFFETDQEWKKFLESLEANVTHLFDYQDLLLQLHDTNNLSLVESQIISVYNDPKNIERINNEYKFINLLEEIRPRECSLVSGEQKVLI